MNPAILFPYGCCPVCGLPGVRRDRRPDGNDRCEDGHTYPSRDAKPFAPSLDVAYAEAPDAEHCPCVPALRAEIERLREECHTLRLWAEEAAAAENANAEDAKRERAAVVAWLRACAKGAEPAMSVSAVGWTLAHADCIERGEHNRGGTE